MQFTWRNGGEIIWESIRVALTIRRFTVIIWLTIKWFLRTRKIIIINIVNRLINIMRERIRNIIAKW